MEGKQLELNDFRKEIGQLEFPTTFTSADRSISIRDTSVLAFLDKIGELGKYQTRMYYLFQRIGKPICDNRLIELFNLNPKMQPRARRNELYKLGLIKLYGYCTCKRKHREWGI